VRARRMRMYICPKCGNHGAWRRRHSRSKTAECKRCGYRSFKSDFWEPDGTLEVTEEEPE